VRFEQPHAEFIEPQFREVPRESGRLDIFILRLAELGTRRLEGYLTAATGQPVNLWDSIGGIRAICDRALEDLRVPDQKVTPEMLAERLGLLKKRKPRKQLRKAG
jgi:hypothetical protein